MTKTNGLIGAFEKDGLRQKQNTAEMVIVVTEGIGEFEVHQGNKIVTTWTVAVKKKSF